MKYNQNSRILQITEKTLIIGVDVASETNYARAFDYRGVELAKLLKFNNDNNGFKTFSEWVKSVAKQQQKQQVMVGMEPTGHYWFTFAQHLKDHQLKIVLVNPFHVKRSKELMIIIRPKMTERTQNHCHAGKRRSIHGTVHSRRNLQRFTKCNGNPLKISEAA